ncbi:MAG: 5'(3')-deoxyribonucleotidase [Bacteroidota bacterium]
MKRKIIAVDMDNVMADVTSQLADWYFDRTGVRVNEAEMIGKEETAVYPDGALARSFLYEPGFFFGIKVMKDCQEVLAEMNKVHDVFIVSAAMEFPNSLPEKYEWLQVHFPFLGWQQFVFCGSKTIVRADYLVDDHLKNLDFFMGNSILYTAPHNQLVTGYQRVNNWQELADLFL